MTTILIGGYYGAGNVGDEAILHALLTDLRRYDSGLNFIVVSKNPEKTKNELGVESIEWEDIDALMQAASRTDLIVLGGGGIFHDYWGIDPDRYLRKGFWDITAFGSLPLLAELLNLPCVIVGVGVGPFKTDQGREHTRRAFERCQAATVRDQESIDFLRQTGLREELLTPPFVRVAPDVVFRFELRTTDRYEADELLEEKFSIGKDIPLLGISLRYWEADTPLEGRLSTIARGVRQFLETHPPVHALMIPFQVLDATPHTDDSIVLRELSKLIAIPGRVHLIDTALGPHLAQALIRRCTAILGMRLHSIIMAINMGTPAVAISYAPKVQAVMKRAGLEEYCNLTLAPDAGHLEKQLGDIWEKNAQLRGTLLSIGESLKSAAHEHAQVVIELLEHLEPCPPLGFAQEFALKQTRLLFQADIQNARMQQELSTYGQNLEEIHASRLWKFVKAYYRLVELPALKRVRRFFLSRTAEGNSGLENTPTLRVGEKENGIYPPAKTGQSWIKSVVTEDEFDRMVIEFNRLSLKGIFAITGSLVAQDISTERAINLSKSLARQGWGILYITDRANQNAPAQLLAGKEYRNIFQISLDMFMNKAGSLEGLSYPNKYFMIESPHPNLFLPALKLRSQGFGLIYEIATDWETLSQSSQIPWFDGNMEPAFIVNANVVTATSQPLLDRFSQLRRDIHLLTDGDPSKALLETLEGGKWISL